MTPLTNSPEEEMTSSSAMVPIPLKMINVQMSSTFGTRYKKTGECHGTPLIFEVMRL